jgi:uncharacterized protein
MNLKKQKYFDKIIKEIKNEISNLNTIYVFGSILTKYFREDSDIDIAILSENINDKIKIFELKQKLEYILKRDIDLIDLNSCIKKSLVLAMQILKHGKIIYNQNTEKRLEFEDLIFFEYVRFQDFREQNEHL